jgi:RHS repeat-associated protein
MTSPREIVLCQYHYDPLDRLIGHALPDVPERQRFYCKSRLTTEIQGAMRYSIVQQGDQLLAQQRSEGDAPDTTLLATDQQRSVLKVLKGEHPPLPIAYSPYGHRPIESGLLSLLGFNGERPDPLTGCYLLGNGYRAFNPVLMRFNSPDSWSPLGKGGLNTYAYCAGDPINGSDPNGHKPEFLNRLLKAILPRSAKKPVQSTYKFPKEFISESKISEKLDEYARQVQYQSDFAQGLAATDAIERRGAGSLFTLAANSLPYNDSFFALPKHLRNDITNLRPQANQNVELVPLFEHIQGDALSPPVYDPRKLGNLANRSGTLGDKALQYRDKLNSIRDTNPNDRHSRLRDFMNGNYPEQN